MYRQYHLGSTIRHTVEVDGWIPVDVGVLFVVQRRPVPIERVDVSTCRVSTERPEV